MSETFDGTVDVQDGGALTTVHLDGNFGTVRAGGNGKDGSIVVRNAAEFDVVTISGAAAGGTGLYLSDGAGNSVIEMLDLGRINVRQVIDGENRYLLQLDTGGTASVTVGAEDASGIVTVRNTANADVISTAPRVTSSCMTKAASRCCDSTAAWPRSLSAPRARTATSSCSTMPG
jgi:hypothetical protein